MEVTCFFPGIMGSRLRQADGTTVWPPTAAEAITSLSEEKIAALLSEDDLTPAGAVEVVCVRTVYGGVLRTIESAGFSRQGGNKRLEVMDYDWRLDIVGEIAPTLARRLDQLVVDGATSFHFISHSMGGLVARVLLQDSQYNSKPWRNQVKQLVTMATPFGGAPLALARLLGQDGALGIPKEAFGALRAIPRLRAAYQLLPPPNQPFIWTIAGGQLRTIDLYDPDFASQNQLLPASLDAVVELHKILLKPLPADLGTLQFAGTGLETVTRLARGGALHMVRDDDAGDETVPIQSATAVATPTMILPAEHLDIVNNSKLNRSVRALLGGLDEAIIFGAEEPGDLASGTPAISISAPLDAGVAGVRSHINVLLTSSATQADRRLQINVQRLDPQSENVDEDVTAMPLTLSANVPDIRLRLPMPPQAGLYSISVSSAGQVKDTTQVIVRNAQ